MILKFLLVAAVIAVVYFMFIKEKPLPKNAADEKNKDTKSSDMVECSTCKVYCELDEAFISGNRYYCSKECLEKGQ